MFSFSRDRSEWGQKTLAAKCNELQHLGLLIQLFNLTNATPIHALKLHCMFLTISNGSFAIMMMSEHPIMASFGVLVGAGGCVLYSVMYERAFFVSDLMERAKLNLNAAITNGGHLDGPTRKYMRKRVESVPAVGIKVGSFGTFERASTPIFLDFVMRNIAAVLLSRRL